jgi:hypothetical protein
MTRREWCMSSEAFYYPSVLMEAAGCSLAPQVASSQGCSPVSLCRLASCRAAVAHPFEPGTLITALSLACCAGSWTYSPLALLPPTTASLSYASPCVIVVVVFSPAPAFRLFSATLSPLASLFLYWFACPQSSLPLCAHVACCSQLCAWLSTLSIYTFLRSVSYHLVPSRLRLPSQRVS